MSHDPFVIPTGGLPPAGATSPADAPPPPDEEPTGAAVVRMSRLAARRPSRLARWFWTTLTGLVALVLSVAAYDFVSNLLARSPALAALAMALIVVLVLALFAFLVREALAFRRLGRLDDFRLAAADAASAPDRRAALALSERLERFYAGRPELAWSRQTLAEQREGVLDGDALLTLTERTLMAPLDAAARREIELASRTVAAATAIVPLALVDVLAALATNVRMIRRLAEIYGGRAGTLGSLRLLRMVATHLLATGAVAVGDDLISSVAGGSALARVSRRFGEGVVNGALTARIGIAAMEVCRPLPFAALPRPRVSNLIGRSLTGLFQKT
jgi:putative membrane protein